MLHHRDGDFIVSELKSYAAFAFHPQNFEFGFSFICFFFYFELHLSSGKCLNAKGIQTLSWLKIFRFSCIFWTCTQIRFTSGLAKMFFYSFSSIYKIQCSCFSSFAFDQKEIEWRKSGRGRRKKMFTFKVCFGKWKIKYETETKTLVLGNWKESMDAIAYNIRCSQFRSLTTYKSQTLCISFRFLDF